MTEMTVRFPFTWNSHVTSKEQRYRFKKKVICAVFAIIFLFFIPPLSAQNFTPLQSGDYKVVEEDTSYDPGAQITGSYRAFYDMRKKNIIFGETFEGKMQQDISLKFQSKINTNIALHATLGNRILLVTEQETAYVSGDPAEKSDSTSDAGMAVFLREGYLEYNHNPNASLKVGKQPVNLADRDGLIYQGTVTAISQECRIGTWCYYVGGARLGNRGDSGLFWAQLDYPVYQSGILVPDPWGEKPTREQHSFNVEIFRVMYRGNDIPLGDYGGWIGKNSVYHDTTDDTLEGDRVFFDNDGVEYIGFTTKWQFYNFRLKFTWSNLAGSRKYHTGNQEDGGYRSLSHQNIGGHTYLLNNEYQLSNEWKFGFTFLTASGNRFEIDGEKIWESDSQAYFEIKKGAHGDALIYFNGKDGIGDGHSVANLNYYALTSSYRSWKNVMAMDVALYSFMRNKPVFVNKIGSAVKTAQEIGYELDFSLTWQLEERLSFQFYTAIFLAKAAYTPNDNLRPEEEPEDFSLLGIDLKYIF